MRAAAIRGVQGLRIVHPFPTVMNALATAALSELATHGRAPALTVLRLSLTMLTIQSAIGVVNDLRDYELDQLSKVSKPLISGAITTSAARALAGAALVVAALLAAGFGAVVWLLAMLGLSCGLAYDLWLKRTPWSALPYALALPLLPIWVWVATGRFTPALLSLIPLGLLLGVSLQLANSLTDYDQDEQARVRGLAHLLGKRRALILCWVAYALALLLIAVSIPFVDYRLPLLAPALGVALAMLFAAVTSYGRAPSQAMLQRGWTALVLGSAAIAVGWLGALRIG